MTDQPDRAKALEMERRFLEAFPYCSKDPNTGTWFREDGAMFDGFCKGYDAALLEAEADVERLRADKARLDYLEDEKHCEDCWRDAGFPGDAPRSLFRENMPITRARIDEALNPGAPTP